MNFLHTLRHGAVLSGALLLGGLGSAQAMAVATGSGQVMGSFTRWEGDLKITSVTLAGGTPQTTQELVEYVKVNGTLYAEGAMPALPDGVVVDNNGTTWRTQRGGVDLAAGSSEVNWLYKNPDRAEYTANRIAFEGAAFTHVAAGQAFKLGTITVTNGIWFQQAQANLTVSTQSSDFGFDGNSFTDTLIYTVTLNDIGVATPQQNADFVSFLGHPELGQIRVFEAADSPTGSNSGSVELWGAIGSLTPLSLRNAQGGVFVQTTAVPEPSSWALVLAGLASLGWLGRRGGRSAIAPTTDMAR